MTSVLRVLILVAPIDPYPMLFKYGPRATWLQRVPTGVEWATYSGRPIGSFRRGLGDLRELIRFPAIAPQLLGTVKANSRVNRVMSSLTRQTTEGQQGNGTFVSKMTYRVLVLLNRIVSSWEKIFLSKVQQVRNPRVIQRGNHFEVDVPATMYNSTLIQQQLLRHLASMFPNDGVVLVTASGFIDLARLQTWVSQCPPGVVIGGSSAPDSRGNSSSTFLSGFCQYYSASAVKVLASAKDLDFSLLVDEAFSKWIIDHGYSWVDPGISWNFVDNQGACPLCADSRITVVRCTVHGNRVAEAALMHSLDHVHASQAMTL